MSTWGAISGRSSPTTASKHKKYCICMPMYALGVATSTTLNPITNHVCNIRVTVVCAVLCVTNAQRQMPSWSTWHLNMSFISSPFALCRPLRFGYKIHKNHNTTLAFLSRVSPGLVTSHQPSYLTGNSPWSLWTSQARVTSDKFLTAELEFSSHPQTEYRLYQKQRQF